MTNFMSAMDKIIHFGEATLKRIADALGVPVKQFYADQHSRIMVVSLGVV
jgi:hypothetical protein